MASWARSRQQAAGRAYSSRHIYRSSDHKQTCLTPLNRTVGGITNNGHQRAQGAGAAARPEHGRGEHTHRRAGRSIGVCPLPCVKAHPFLLIPFYQITREDQPAVDALQDGAEHAGAACGGRRGGEARHALAVCGAGGAHPGGAGAAEREGVCESMWVGSTRTARHAARDKSGDEP